MTPHNYVQATTTSVKSLAAIALILSLLTFATQPAHAEGFDTLYAAESVCQEIRTFQTGVGDDELNTISIPEGPGPIVAAFVTWIGVNDLTPDAVTEPGRADSSLTINGNEVVGVAPTGAAASQEVANDKYWYAWNADIGPSGANILNGSSSEELTISGWKVSAQDQFHGRNGAEIDVIYDVSPCSEKVDVTILSGVDWIYETADHPQSTTMILPVAATADERTETVRLSLWGGEKSQTDRCRFSALWMLTGSDPLPIGEQLDLFTPTRHKPAFGINNAVEIVANPFLGADSPCDHEPNPMPDVAYEAGHIYPQGASSSPYNAIDVRRHSIDSDAEVLSIELDLRIPGGSSWVALQLESEGEHYGESGAWTSSFTTRTSATSEASSSNITANTPALSDNTVVPDTTQVEKQDETAVLAETTPEDEVVSEVKGLTVSRGDVTTETNDGSVEASSSISADSSSSGTLALTGTSTFALVGGAIVMICAGLLLVSRRTSMISDSSEA